MHLKQYARTDERNGGQGRAGQNNNDKKKKKSKTVVPVKAAVGGVKGKVNALKGLAARAADEAGRVVFLFARLHIFRTQLARGMAHGAGSGAHMYIYISIYNIYGNQSKKGK